MMMKMMNMKVMKIVLVIMIMEMTSFDQAVYDWLTAPIPTKDDLNTSVMVSGCLCATH